LFLHAATGSGTPVRQMKKKGSSRNTGECGTDFEEEIFLVAVAIGPALDDLDGVVDAFDDAGVQGVTASGHDAVQVVLKAPGEGLQGINAALMGLVAPVLPSLRGLCRLAVEPQLLEL